MTPEQLDELEKLTEQWYRYAGTATAGELADYALPLVKAVREARAEVERLREASRQVHALAEVLVTDWDVLRIGQAITEIHKITKGMVE